MLYCYCVALLLFVLSYVLIACTVPLPPGVNPIAVDKYINISITVGRNFGLGYALLRQKMPPTQPMHVARRLWPATATSEPPPRHAAHCLRTTAAMKRIEG